MSYSPYAGEIPAREKIVNAYAADHARAAEDAEKAATAFEYWDKVFDGNFPAYG